MYPTSDLLVVSCVAQIATFGPEDATAKVRAELEAAIAPVWEDAVAKNKAKCVHGVCFLCVLSVRVACDCDCCRDILRSAKASFVLFFLGILLFGGEFVHATCVAWTPLTVSSPVTVTGFVLKNVQNVACYPIGDVCL